LSQDVKNLGALLEISSNINSQRNLSYILNTITREILTCFQADQSSIMLFDQKSKTLKTMAVYGKGAEFAKDALIPLGKGIAGWVVKSGKALVLNGKVDPADFPGIQAKNRDISSAMCVPLKIGLYQLNREPLGLYRRNKMQNRNIEEGGTIPCLLNHRR